MITTRRQVEKAAEDKDLPAKISQISIVRWDADGRNVRPGPGQIILIHLIIGIIGIIVIKCVQE